MGSRDRTALELHLHRESGAAYLVSDDGDEGSAVWLPKSQVDIVDSGNGRSPVRTFAVPEWLAEKEGLI